MQYMVIVNIMNNKYLTKVSGVSSLSGAEHKILDLGICGRHEYGVAGATAYDAVGMKTDTFLWQAMSADPISLEQLTEIIEANNARIKAKDEAEDRIREIEKQMKALAEELEAAKRIVAA